MENVGLSGTITRTETVSVKTMYRLDCDGSKEGFPAISPLGLPSKRQFVPRDAALRPVCETIHRSGRPGNVVSLKPLKKPGPPKARPNPKTYGFRSVQVIERNMQAFRWGDRPWQNFIRSSGRAGRYRTKIVSANSCPSIRRGMYVALFAGGASSRRTPRRHVAAPPPESFR